MQFRFLDTLFQIRIWNGEDLKRFVAVDTETTMVEDLKSEVPELVTLQYYDGGDTVYYVPPNRINDWLEKANASNLIFHNVPFDWFVIDKYLNNNFALNTWLEQSRLHDTQILERLLGLANRGYVTHLSQTGLGFLAKERLGVELDKAGEERVTFGQFKGLNPSDIPEEHLIYGAKDPITTYMIFQQQRREIGDTGSNSMLSQQIQIAGSIGMQQMIRNGIGFDLERRNAYVAKAEQELESLSIQLAHWGVVRGRPGFNTAFDAVIEHLNIPLPKTKDGHYSHAEEALRPYRDRCAFINNFLTYMEKEKELSFVAKLDKPVIHARYDILKNTGRTGCSSPNMQNLPRAGGIREMFVPVEKGNVFVDIDYSSLELATLAQICYTYFGESRMGDIINSGECLHYATASSVYGKPVTEVTKEERQFSKIPNFGFGANMSAKTFVDYCKGYGVEIDEKRSKEVKKAWLRAYPEMNKFFNYQTPKGFGQRGNSWTLTGRKRADCSYTELLNSRFQGLAADGAKIAMYYIAKAGYRVCAFIHDQFVVECPREDAERVMEEVSKLMVEGMKTVCPDVNIGVEGQIIERFCK